MSATPHNKYFFVIEGDRCYWTGHSCDQSSFDADIQRAVKFYDAGSAWQIKCWLLKAFSVRLRVTEHAWIERGNDVEARSIVDGATEVAP